MGRRNWLHVGGEVGGERAAHLFSLTISCHRLKVKPYAYQCDVVPRLSSHPPREIWKLTARGWRDSRAQSAAKTIKRQDRESRDVPWPVDQPVPRTRMASPKQPTDLEFSIRRQSNISLAVTANLRSDLPDVFPADDRSMIGTIVTELGTNILQYAVHGVVRVRCLATDGRNGMRVVAEDHGSDITDLEAALKDGFSTGGNLGLGLPAVRLL